jgi:hypothetical protein
MSKKVKSNPQKPSETDRGAHHEVGGEHSVQWKKIAEDAGKEKHGYGIGDCWFESHDTRIHRVLCDRHFWWDVTQHLFLPLAIVIKFSSINKNLHRLRSDPSSKKLASIWLRKLLGFAAAWCAFVATIVAWKASGLVVSNASDHLLRNISTVT